MLKPDRIIGMTSSFFDSCVLFTASDLGVFARLAESGPMDAASLASALQLDERGTRLLLDACVALELLTKQAETYSNTPETAVFLVPGSPGDLSAAIRYNRDVYAAWGKLDTLVRTGKPVEKPECHLGQDAERTPRRDVHLRLHVIRRRATLEGIEQRNRPEVGRHIVQSPRHLVRRLENQQ